MNFPNNFSLMPINGQKTSNSERVRGKGLKRRKRYELQKFDAPYLTKFKMSCVFGQGESPMLPDERIHEKIPYFMSSSQQNLGLFCEAHNLNGAISSQEHASEKPLCRPVPTSLSVERSLKDCFSKSPEKVFTDDQHSIYFKENWSELVELEYDELSIHMIQDF